MIFFVERRREVVMIWREGEKEGRDVGRNERERESERERERDEIAPYTALYY
jgi:hypothetical protein